MTYPINLTDGTLVVTVPPGVRDTTTFSITIIGKNVSNYGEDIAENFIHMLENFSNTTPPANPLVGQLWYDSAVGAIKVFDGVNFIAIQTRVGTVLPSSPSAGDMFFNENQRQLYVADSGGTFRFAGIPGGFVDNFSAVTNVEATRYGTNVENLYLLEAGTLRPRAVLAQIYEWNGNPGDHATLVPTDAQNGRTVMAIWSDHPSFVVDPTSPLFANISAGFPSDTINKGLNIRLGSSASLHTPLAVSFGGTGASNASTARTNLGAVNIAGDTMTGDLTVGTGASARTITVNGGAGFARDHNFNTGGSGRWTIRANATAEAGSNSGSDFEIIRRSDTGASIGTAISINRATGSVNFPAGFTSTVPLAITSGGTGSSTASGARTNLGLGSLAVLNSPLPLANGGTGATTASDARTNLGLGSLAVLNSPLAIANGGTGATTSSAARTNLGLGTISTQNSNTVNITGGSITGITPLAIADGGTGASTAASARTNLVVVHRGGDTMTGTLTIAPGSLVVGDGSGTSTRDVIINGGNGSARRIELRTSNVGRWDIRASTTSETGGNAGSDLQIFRRDDAGNSLGTPLTITRSNGAVNMSNVSITGGAISGITSLIFHGLVRPNVNNTHDIGTSSIRVRTVFAGTFNGTATSAQYSDLAERFHSDLEYEPGVIVMLGGENEITITKEEDSVDVFGVISTDPAIMMNSAAGENDTHPYVALSGRVPTFVTGKVKKGDRIVTSNAHGVGKAAISKTPNIYTVIGRSLEDKDTEELGKVMVAVGVK